MCPRTDRTAQAPLAPRRQLTLSAHLDTFLQLENRPRPDCKRLKDKGKGDMMQGPPGQSLCSHLLPVSGAVLSKKALRHDSAIRSVQLKGALMLRCSLYVSSNSTVLCKQSPKPEKSLHTLALIAAMLPTKSLRATAVTSCRVEGDL